MKHLALVTTSFPDAVPGSESAGSFVADFAAVLSQYCKVTVIAPGLKGGIEVREKNLTIRRFTVPSLPLSLLVPFNPLHWPGIVRTMMAGRDTLKSVCDEEIVDHILALWIFPSGYWAHKERRKRGVPYSVWALGSDVWVLSKIPGMKKILQDIIRESSRSFADGYILKQDVEAISGRPCEFLASTRDFPILLDKRLKSAPPYRLAYLGRWHPNKGIDILLESLELLKGPDWEKIEEIRIFGGGPMEGLVSSACEALKRKGCPVTIGGYLNKEGASELLAWTDYLLLPSRIESIPVLYSDAMKSRCPVISTPVGDLPRLTARLKSGLLSEEVNKHAFAKAIRVGLHDSSPSLYADGLDKASAEFDLGAIVRKFVEMLFPDS
jgi:glycosyltransferase involved in cell wall biosynthesis